MSTSTSNMLSVKVVFISTSVLSAAIMLSTTDIAVYAPWIYNGVISWLQPPYLYLVINCIIITIVASSKFQLATEDVPITPLSLNAVQQPVEISQTDFLSLAAEYKYDGAEKGLESDALDLGSSNKTENSIFSGADAADDAMCNKENECVVVAKSMWTSAENNDATDFVKPPASARFSHRRNLKASPEGGGGRTVLGVSKSNKQDTLENTWKTITEGRAIPMSRHLKKSETWERGNPPSPSPALKTMTKAETFKERSGSAIKRKEPSLSQDELNRRVEAFITKFNEDMRLQRQESLNHYTEIIKQ